MNKVQATVTELPSYNINFIHEMQRQVTASGRSPPLEPSCRNLVMTPLDGALIIEAGLRGQINHVARPPLDHERPFLARHGNVFLFERNCSGGLTVWDDGLRWSGPFTDGAFQEYHQLPGDRGTQGSIQPGFGIDENGLLDDTDHAFLLRKACLTVKLRGFTHNVVAYTWKEAETMGPYLRPVEDPGFDNVDVRQEIIDELTRTLSETGLEDDSPQQKRS